MNLSAARAVSVLFFVPFLVAGCGSQTGTTTPTSTGVTVVFSLDADLTSAAHFFDFPYPSDLRLNTNGGPDLSGFPNPMPIKAVTDLTPIAIDRKGFPMNPVTYFQFTGALPPQLATTTIAATKTSPVLLIDIQEGATQRLHLYPVVAETLATDQYMPPNLLAVAPRPGIVLEPLHQHAIVILRSLKDATGQLLDVDASLAGLAAGQLPSGARAAAAQTLYAPLWKALDDLGVARTDVAAAATVFTTGDVVADNYALATALAAKYSITIDGLALNPAELQLEDHFCELIGSVTYPQFQTGIPPFDTGGVFVAGADGLPIMQRTELAPIVITIPRTPMPATGYPLIIYFHGSGGDSTEVADSGKDVGNPPMEQAGAGPAYYFADQGIAAAASALPVNPERLPGASETAYLNINNLSAFRDTFRQGIIEQHMFIQAVLALKIDPALLAACVDPNKGPSLPHGATTYTFNAELLMAQGQSMGGMYTNLIGATVPGIKAVVPTGAGGYWSYFIFDTMAVMGAPTLLAALLGTDASIIDFLHPTMMLFETAAEAIDPMISMPRLARRPLPNHPVRPVYEPTGFGDSYFASTDYDAMALAYGNQEAGAAVWPTMQTALALEGDDGLQTYPVTQNRKSETGVSYTGVNVQYMADGPYDPHSIYRQLDAVKYQYECFYQSFLSTGIAVIAAPGPTPGSACPQ